ncbi:ribosome-binding factor A [Ferrimicrobium sp.]|uniref:ribosome-binding factor A n=1 Tax=Ferrimicrobium sp. TaxID=2926050 RepID=UPI00260692D4|nr:ribosome-binding factor A [Ferrimicrobium sp.]
MASRGSHGYERVDRVSRLLQEVVAWELERIGDIDDRVALLTITDVRVRPDLRSALVFFASLTEEAEIALEAHRIELQAAIARQVRMKRTPQLQFVVDDVLATSEAIEVVLRRHDQNLG